MNRKLPLSRLRVRNFKAIRDSRQVMLTPLTAFIGNNGSGKSSVIEGMEALQTIVLQGLDAAMHRWHGFEHIWNRAVPHEPMKRSTRPANPMVLECAGRHDSKALKTRLTITPASNDLDRLLIDPYEVAEGRAALGERRHLVEDGQVTDPRLRSLVEGWQFLRLTPSAMSEPIPRRRTAGKVRLAPDGSNIAEYLLTIRELDAAALDGIIDTLRFVLPFASNLQASVTSELERKVYLLLSEQGVSGKLPGWLLSTGTLRSLALLAVFRHPEPSPVIVVEELENGLDPRTIHLIVEEIRAFTDAGLGQVIITTHSPYLLDLLALEHIVLVERDATGSPAFRRPADDDDLAEWADRFSPGKLYTMGSLSRKGTGHGA